MENLFVSAHDHTSMAIRDAIYSKIQQSKAILTCIMYSTKFVRSDIELDQTTLYHALWAVEDYLEELDSLFQELEKLKLVQ